MSELSQGTCFSNLKSVSATMLEQLAFNPQNLGSCFPGHALFSENMKEDMSGVSLGTCFSNLNSITVLVLLTFNAQKYRGNVTLDMPPS